MDPFPTVETGDRLRATLTGRTYRILGVGASQVRVVAPPDGGCRAFAVAHAELARDIAPLTDIAESTVRAILPRLVEQNIVAVDTSERKNRYTLNSEGLTAIVSQHRQCAEIDQLRQEVQDGS